MLSLSKNSLSNIWRKMDYLQILMIMIIVLIMRQLVRIKSPLDSLGINPSKEKGK